MSFWIQFLTTVLAVATIDFIYTFYLAFVDSYSSLKAAILSAIIVALGSYTVISYTDDNDINFMKSDKLTALLCEGIKELALRVEALENK